MTRIHVPAIFLLSLAILASVSAFGIADGKWLHNVPVRDHAKTNPYRGEPAAIAAGKRVFRDHCAQCHGDHAEGTKKRPSLDSIRVQEQASEGDLHWLLVNGNMRKCMPSWAKLPDQQLWQTIAYVKSLSQ